MVHSLKKKKKQKKNTQKHNRKQTKIAKISSDSKLSSWRLMAQQSDQAERQQDLELSAWDQKEFSSCLNPYPCP